jgi:hypothetical protein
MQTTENQPNVVLNSTENINNNTKSRGVVAEKKIVNNKQVSNWGSREERMKNRTKETAYITTSTYLNHQLYNEFYSLSGPGSGHPGTASKATREATLPNQYFK